MSVSATKSDLKNVSADVRKQVNTETRKIRRLLRRSVEDIIAIGEALSCVKIKLSECRGVWTTWLRSEFGWSPAQARRWIAVFERFKPLKLSDKNIELQPSALYLLSQDQTPESAVNEAITRAEKGERITHNAVQEILKRHRPQRIEAGQNADLSISGDLLVTDQIEELLRINRNWQTLLVDPPWKYQDKNCRGSASYRTMSLDELAELPISSLANADGCQLHLWTTTAFLPSAIKLIDHWGFEYRSMLVW